MLAAPPNEAVGKRRIGPADEGEVLGAEKRRYAGRPAPATPLRGGSTRAPSAPLSGPRYERSSVGIKGAPRRSGLAPATDAGGPVIHQPPPPFEQVRPGVGGLDLVLDDVGPAPPRPPRAGGWSPRRPQSRNDEWKPCDRHSNHFAYEVLVASVARAVPLNVNGTARYVEHLLRTDQETACRRPTGLSLRRSATIDPTGARDLAFDRLWTSVRGWHAKPHTSAPPQRRSGIVVIGGHVCHTTHSTVAHAPPP